jgi:bacillopeptidase F
MSKQSRLEEIAKRRSERNIIIILVGIIGLVLLFFFYGIPFLINFSLWVEGLRGNKDMEVPVNASSYIAPPILDPLRDATNSAQINVSGSASPNEVIWLYVNGKYLNQVKVGGDKGFIFKDISLDTGANDIKAKAVISDKESGYSENMHIVYINKEPTLEITSPQDNQSISNGDGQVKVEGKTDPSVRVTVNNYWAIVETDGGFSYLLRLQKGDNTIKVVAADDAGNKTEKEIKVKLE